MTRHYLLLMHRYAGLTIASFLLVAGITGMAIAFYDQLDEFLNPTLYQVSDPKREPLPLDIIEKKMDDTLLHGQGIVRYTQFPRHRENSLHFIVVPKDDPQTQKKYPLTFNSVFVDPYTGDILGTRMFGAWRFDRAHIMPWLWEMHYSLTLPFPWGIWLFGAAAFIWLFDCFFAAYLTFPRGKRKFFGQWKKAWKIKWSAGSSRLIRDFHIALSLWLWLFFIMLALSSVMFNLNHEIYQPVLSTFVKYEHARDRLPEVSSEQRKHKISQQKALEKGREYVEQWQKEKEFTIYKEDSLTLDIGKHAYRFKVKSSLDLPNSYAQTAVYLSAHDGQYLTKHYPYIDTGNAISTWLTALHMGRIFGFWYQIVISIAGAVVTIATVTGVLIWWRKRKQTRSSPKDSKTKYNSTKYSTKNKTYLTS